MKRKDITEKWQKVLIPAEVRLCEELGGQWYYVHMRSHKHKWPMEFDIADRDYSYFIPVDKWPKKGEGQ